MELELLRANLVRTLVPVLVGALATAVPLFIDKSNQAAVYPLIAAAVTYVYYAFIRIGETKYPQLGRLLGRTRPDPLATRTAAAGQPGPQVALDGSGRPVAVRLGGVVVEGVESVELTSGHGQPTLLTLRIRDPHVELGDPA